MSCLSRVLRSTFRSATTNRQFSAAAATDTGTPGKSLRNFVSSERNPKRLVEKFKKACESDRFRTKTAVYERTVRRLTSWKKFQWVEEILEEQKKYRDMSKEGFVARIMTLYGRAGMFENAQKVFDEMPDTNCKRTVLSFNALLGACLNSKKFDLIEGLFKELPGKLSIEPDIVSYNTFIKALCGKGSLDDAVAVLDEIAKKGLKPDLVTFNTLLSELYMNERFERGEEIWAKMAEKNVARDIRSYNARLRGLAMQRRSKDLVNVFEGMKSDGIKPDVFSFNAMIRGFINEEKAEEAITWYNEMEKNDCRPDKATFATLLPVLCEKGNLGSAFEVCKEIFSKRYLVDRAILQQVVDELVKGCKREEAKEIVELAKSSDYLQYKLGMPSEE